MKTAIIVCFFLAWALTAQQLSGAMIFYYKSSPLAWVAQGETNTITQGYTFSGFKYGNQAAYTNAFYFTISNSFSSWNLQFVGPDRTIAVPGFYPNAERWPFQDPGHPGLNFSGNGRGNNTLTGEFRVLEAVYSGTTVERFAVDFWQYGDGSTAKWNYGSFRFNSDIPITPIPEPSSLVLLFVVALVAAQIVRHRNKCYDISIKPFAATDRGFAGVS